MSQDCWLLDSNLQHFVWSQFCGNICVQKTLQCQWYCRVRLRSVNDSTESIMLSKLFKVLSLYLMICPLLGRNYADWLLWSKQSMARVWGLHILLEVPFLQVTSFLWRLVLRILPWQFSKFAKVTSMLWHCKPSSTKTKSASPHLNIYQKLLESGTVPE